MKHFRLLIALFISGVSFSQTPQYRFEYQETKLDQVLTDIEKQFDIKYSYADSIVAPQRITLSTAMYSLGQLHDEITKQTGLAITRINRRYYSLFRNPDDAVKKEELDEIVVESFLTKGISKSGQKFTISPKKTELPGVTDADVLLSLQQLPGVKSPNETASGLHIRGGTPDQNLILWDGIRMYHPGHLFGMISGYNANITQTVQYYNKATNPKFGERISATIAMETSNAIPDSLQVEAGLNAINADVCLKIPVSKKTGLQVAGRKSFTEWLQSPTFNALADKVFQNTNFRDFGNENRFGFQDYSLKLNVNPNGRSAFSATGIAIDNHLDFNTVQENNTISNQKMDILNYGFGGRWTYKFSDAFSQQMQLYYSAYTFDYDRNRQYQTGDFEVFTKMNRVTDSGAELNYEYAVDNLGAEFGYQLSGNDLSHMFTNRTQDLEVELDQKHLQNNTHSGYGYLKYALSGWRFNAGARFSYFSQLHDKVIEPRISVRKEFADFVFQISYERKSQIVSQIRESVANDLSLENYIWILSDGSEYPIQKANQFTAGMTYKNKSFLLDIDAYFKKINGITSLSFGFMHQFDSEIHRGNGYTKGVDILIQKTAPTWRAWVTYTYQDSQNSYHGLNNGNDFPISSDIRHAVTLSAQKQWGDFSLAAGWFWHTGKPYSVLDEENDIVSFNSERLPVYHRMDVSAAYRFHKAKHCSAKAGVSVLNLYGRHSVISKEYERQYLFAGDFFHSNYTVRDYHSLGFTPNVFVRVDF